MSVAETFSHSDAHTILDGAQTQVHHTINALSYLDTQSTSVTPKNVANEPHVHDAYHTGTVARRRSRRERRALRA